MALSSRAKNKNNDLFYMYYIEYKKEEVDIENVAKIFKVDFLTGLL